MTLPRVRLTITPAEYALLKPGLDSLANGLATAKLGNFPDRYAWMPDAMSRGNVYGNRAFNEEMATKVISVRSKIWELAISRKIRLDILEISAAAFALRLFKRSAAAKCDTDAASALARKLEKYRKRAKRRTVLELSQVETLMEAARWRSFVAWCRFNLVPTGSSATTRVPRRRLWSEQRSGLAIMIEQAIEKHHRAPLSQSQSKRVVRLIKEEFRRGRHPITLRELLKDQDGNSQTLLLRMVAKKLPLTPLAGAKLPVSVVQSEIGEKFMEARQRRIQQASHQPGATAAPVSAIRPDLAQERQPASLTNSGDQAASRPSDRSMTAAMSKFLQRIERSYWKDVVNCAIAVNHSERTLSTRMYPSKSIEEVIEISQPKDHEYSMAIIQDLVCFLQEWLLNWLRAYRFETSEIHQILREGYRLAVERSPLPTNAK